MLGEMSDSCTVFWASGGNTTALETALRGLGFGLVKLDPSQKLGDFSISGIPSTEIARLLVTKHRWSGINLPLRWPFGDRLVANLVAETKQHAIAFFEFDQEVWGLSLVRQNRERLNFVNRPEVLDLDPDQTMIDGEVLAREFSVSPDGVSGYLRQLSDVDRGDRAYATDEFTLGNHWARVDVMRALGLVYPNPSDKETAPYALPKMALEPPQAPLSGRGLLKSYFSKFRRG